MPQTSPYVFLSHSGADTQATLELKRRLLGAREACAVGLRVWFDKDDLRPGERWSTQIERAIEKEATAFVVYVGSGGVMNWVEAEVDVALSRAIADSSFPFIPVLAAESESAGALPPFARRYQGVHDPLGKGEELEKLLKAILKSDWNTPIRVIDEPFVGLRPMREDEADRFFGRKAEVAALVDKFRRHRIVAIVADSGTGKSSLAGAGFAPAFRGGALADLSRDGPDDRIWHIVTMRPRANPEEGLRSGVTEAAEKLGRSPDERASLRRRILVSDPSEVAFALECDLPAAKTATLLIVDQFEELFAQTPDALCAPFVKMLLALADSGRDIRVLLTVRADYFNLLSEIRDPTGNEIMGADGRTLFARLTADGRAAILPLKRIPEAGLHEVVCEPLRLAGDGDKSAREALLQAVLREISDQPSDLPLLQVALRATWRQRKATGCRLLEAYESVGGVLGALAREAEKVRNARLSSDDQARLESIFVRLVRLGDTGGATRRTAVLDEFDAPRRALLRRLGDDEHGRLIVVGEVSAEIAHEALITQWPWLQSRLRDEARDVRKLDRLMSKSNEWNQASAERKEGYLAVGAERELFDELAVRHSDWMSGIDRAFVDASNAFHQLELDAKRAEEERKERDRATLRRRFNLLMAAAALLLLAVGVTAWLFLQQAGLRREADSAAAVAEKSKDEADTARKLAETQRNHADAILANATDIIAKVQSQLDNTTRVEATALFHAGAEHGDVGSMRNLGVSYMDGLGIAQDYAMARQWFEKAADKGNQDAMRDLGVLYENGRGVSRDYAKAREWYENAAGKGDASAMFYLGVLYDSGRGVPRDYAKARVWFEKAADKGDPSAMIDLGAMYANGQGVAQDYVKAWEWYEKAADKGDESAMAALGEFYLDGKGAPQDYAKAREWFEKVADKGDASAMFKLGLLYAKGQGVPEDYAKAREWYENAARKGDVNAMTGLGLLYANGQGVAEDYVKAREWYEKAADKDDANAMTGIGLLYANGQGVPRDFAKAREWYEKAADKGNASAMFYLGVLYDSGDGVSQDYAKAREWFEKAADKGDESAMFNLGVLYAEGQGVPRDFAKAREWYEKAADKGNASAMLNLGALFANGKGVPQDYAKAGEWFMKAADKGNASAMLNLGALFANGKGVPQDYAKAREWFEKAADKGIADARERLEELRVEEAAGTGRYSEARQLEEALAAKIEARETEREGKPGGETVQALNSIAWYALLARDYGRALTAAERAHTILPDELIVETNHAHALMFLGRETEAEALYLSHKGERLSKADNRLWESAIAEDFAELQKAGVTDPMMDDIREQLGVFR